MLAVDEDALICDFVEYYHITDIRALPVPLLATLASGLRESSRIRVKLSGQKITLSDMLSAITADRLGRIFWIISGNARGGVDPPDSILDILQGRESVKKETGEMRVFDSPEDFQSKWKEITGN